MLFVTKLNKAELYYITHGLCEYGDMDSDMCILLGISHDEYVKVLLQFNAILVDLGELFPEAFFRDKQYVFENKEDAENCMQHFEEVYITLQKLIGFEFGV